MSPPAALSPFHSSGKLRSRGQIAGLRHRADSGAGCSSLGTGMLLCLNFFNTYVFSQ